MQGAVQVVVISVIIYFGVTIFSSISHKFDFLKDLSVYTETTDCKLFKGIKGAEVSRRSFLDFLAHI
jgi:hypothetical protein